MYVQRCGTNKMFLAGGRGSSPKSSFLSPANKYGQRSFSTSSLNSSLHTPKPLPGSLREQIRLDAFKKTIAESKLNKTSLHRTALKVESESCGVFRSDPRSQVRDLQRQISILREQNLQLKQQRSSDMMLISKQNQLLGRLEREIEEVKDYGKGKDQCDCYLIQQYLETIQGLEIKVSHLEEEKKQYKSEIRELVIKQEQLKVHIQEIQAQKETQKEKDKYKERERSKQKEKERKNQQEMQKERKKVQNDDNVRFHERRQRPKPPGGQGVMRYMEYLKNIRNRQIDEIQNILKE